MLDPLKNLVDDTNGTVRECRSCGMSRSPEYNGCHHCGSEEIAYYEW